jgi:arginine deiminase
LLCSDAIIESEDCTAFAHLEGSDVYHAMNEVILIFVGVRPRPTTQSFFAPKSVGRS